MRFLLFLSLLTVFACESRQSTPSSQAGTTDKTSGLPADFEAFYQRFHQDSAFQMEHIIWPLEGVTSMQTDSQKIVRVPVRIEPEKWVMHKPLDLASSDYVQSWSFFSDEMFEETIKYSAANYGMRRRWAKIAGEWHLIHYTDMQDMGGQ